MLLFQLTDSQSIVTWEHLVSGGGGGAARTSKAAVDPVSPPPQGTSAAAPASPATAAQGAQQQQNPYAPFDNLTDLMCHQAHLAVFLNYMISNCDPAALVSILFFPI